VQGLPFSTYLDPARAPLEAAAVFAPSWQFVCHASDLPAVGTAARFDCAGRSAVVVRAQSGELQAFRNVCRHRGARLIEGDRHTGLAFCVDGRLRCPYHGWEYDDSGALVSIPAGQRFGATFDPAENSLLPAHVVQWRGLVFVAFESPRESLVALLDEVAGAWPDLSAWRRVVEPRTTRCAADWKLAAEHLLDTAHHAIARPTLKPRVFGSPTFEPSDAAALHATAPIAAAGKGDTWSARAYRELLAQGGGAGAAAEYVFLWPNLWLQQAPDGLSVLQVLPGATGSCSYRESRYAAPDASRTMRLLRYLHHRVRRQALAADVRLLARVQQGLASLPGSEAAPIAHGEAGLRWFAARQRECFPSPKLVSAPVKRRRTRARAHPVPET
jgi:phenylpropionate dioxygenase-like ring-hydroxylating dioxygenase large terminal subunit